MLILFILSLFFHYPPGSLPASDGLFCRFKNQTLALDYGMRMSKTSFRQRGGLRSQSLDTLSNWFSASQQYVEIIRQDDPVTPQFGIALGFEFDEANGEYPYTPAFAKIQVKDFRWGGVEFSLNDTLNFTGVSNEVSDDLTIQVDGFQNDTIFGHFYGLLLSGGGTMSPVDSGYFKARLYRVP